MVGWTGGDTGVGVGFDGGVRAGWVGASDIVIRM